MKTNQKIHLTLCLVCTLLCSVTNVSAQPVIGQQIRAGASQHDNFTCLALTSDSGFIAGGSSDSPISGNKTQASRGFYDYWIVKYNKLGKKQWDKTIGGNLNDNLEAIQQTKDGGYILAGASFSEISGEKTENPRSDFGADIWVVKLNNKGQVQWDKTIGGDQGDAPKAIKQTADGGYIITGYSSSGVSGEKTEPNRGFSSSSDFWVIKLNARGTIVWNKTLGGKNDDKSTDVIELANGDLLVAGISNSGISGDKTKATKGLSDGWLVRLNKNGVKLWDKDFGGTSFDAISKLVQIADGKFILAGYSDSPKSGDKSENSKGGNDFWVIKVNGSGAVLSDKTIGGSADDFPQSIEKTKDGGYIIAGSSNSGISGNKTEANRGDEDFWVVKFNKQDALLWDKTIGGNAWDDFVTIKETKPNQFQIGGFSQSPISGDKRVPTTQADYWLVKLNYAPPVAPGVAADAVAGKLNNPAQSFSIYPNPAQKVLYIQSSRQSTFTLTDQSGRVVFAKQVSGTVSVDIENLTPGTYYLNNKTSGIRKKVIITK